MNSTLSPLNLDPRGYMTVDLQGRYPASAFTGPGSVGCYSESCEPEFRPALGAALKEAEAFALRLKKTDLVAALEGLGELAFRLEKTDDLRVRVQNALIDRWFPARVINGRAE